MTLPRMFWSNPHTVTLNYSRDCPLKIIRLYSFGVRDGRHFWTDLDLNEMKVVDLQWERSRGTVESRLLLVRLLCLLAVGPHCWHISSMSDSRKLKMLGLSTDPIFLWHAGTKRFSKVQMKSPRFSRLRSTLAELFCSKTLFGQQRITKKKSNARGNRI